MIISGTKQKNKVDRPRYGKPRYGKISNPGRSHTPVGPQSGSDPMSPLPIGALPIGVFRSGSLPIGV